MEHDERPAEPVAEAALAEGAVPVAEADQPGVTEPGVTEPGVTEPGVTEPDRPAAREGASMRVLALGVVVAVAVGFGILLIAGGFGTWGVLGAALLEAACVYLLYRLSPSY